MNPFEGTLIVGGLFALRCVMPVLIVLGIGYLMNRISDHWDAQEQEQKKGRLVIR